MSAPTTHVSPEIAAMLVEHWRTTPTWQKLAYVNELNATLQLLAISDLRRRYPHESEAQVQRRLDALVGRGVSKSRLWANSCGCRCSPLKPAYSLPTHVSRWGSPITPAHPMTSVQS
jgi:hypothetical protein